MNTVTAPSVSETIANRELSNTASVPATGSSRQDRRSSLALHVGEAFNPFNLFDGAMVPSEILRSPHLLPSEKLVFARLTQFAGGKGRAWPSIERVAEEVALSVPQTRRCVSSLERKGLIRRVARSGRSNEFEFLWHEVYEQRAVPQSCPSGLPQSSVSAVPQSSAIGAGQSPTIAGERSRKIGPGRSPVIARRESFESSSSIEKIQKEKNQVKPETRPRTWEPVGSLCRTLFLDEDDARLKPRDSLADPEEEFLERLRERHGNSISPEAILQSVLDALEWQTTDLKQFLDFDARQTTAPEKLTNPAGHYRRVAEKFRLARAKRREIELREQQRDLEKSLQARRAQEQPPKPKCSLSRCDGNGELWDESGLVSACQCEAGKQLPQAVLDLFKKLNAQPRNSHA